MKKLNEFMAKIKSLADAMAAAGNFDVRPVVTEIFAEIAAAEKATDNAVGRVIEMNDTIKGLELRLANQAATLCERDEKIRDLLGCRDRQAEMIVRLESKTDWLSKQTKEVTTAFDVLDAQSHATIREMGCLIDDYAALVVSFREMPFMCFADDPFAALAAIVKADIDKAPIDWKQWPGVI